MPTSQGVQLAEMIRVKTGEFRRLCEGLDEETASRAPEGRWTPKQIVSHLCGPEGVGYTPSVLAFIEQDTPRLDLEAENPFYTGSRPAMTLSELLREFDREYGRLAEVVKELSPEQLARKAQIPMLKESPLGEYPTLEAWVRAIAEHHVGFHIDHLREILEGLGVTVEGKK